MQGAIQMSPWNAFSWPGEVTPVSSGISFLGVPPTAQTLWSTLAAVFPPPLPVRHLSTPLIIHKYLNEFIFYQRALKPTEWRISRITKIQSYNLAKCIKSPHTPPKTHTNLNPAIPHRGMSPLAIIKQVGFKKKEKEKDYQGYSLSRCFYRQSGASQLSNHRGLVKRGSLHTMGHSVATESTDVQVCAHGENGTQKTGGLRSRDLIFYRGLVA